MAAVFEAALGGRLQPGRRRHADAPERGLGSPHLAFPAEEASRGFRADVPGYRRAAGVASARTASGRSLVPAAAVDERRESSRALSETLRAGRRARRHAPLVSLR